jgi:BMFP domain-containing protein YqiC
MSVVLYLLPYLLVGALLRRIFVRNRRVAALRARVEELEAELASRTRVT